MEWPALPIYTMRVSTDSLIERLAQLPSLITAVETIAFAHDHARSMSRIVAGSFGDTLVIAWSPTSDRSRELAAYVSPEEAHGDQLDERSDVYTLGAFLYRLLVGAAPYRGVSAHQVLKQVKHGAPPAIETLAPRAPRELVHIAHVAMARGPAWRYPSARELAYELEQFQMRRKPTRHRRLA
jgi:hypothetical protein